MTWSRSTALLGAAGLAILVSACGDTLATAPKAVVTWYPSTPPPTPGPPGPSASAGPTAAGPAGVGQAQPSGLGTPVANVAATDSLQFTPTSSSLKVGGVIQWKNTGSTPHNVTFDSQPDLTSGTLAQNDTWQVQFTTAGTYDYHCTFHPGMKGQITVSK